MHTVGSGEGIVVVLTVPSFWRRLAMIDGAACGALQAIFYSALMRDT